VLPVAALALGLAPARSAVIYSGLKDHVIPTDWAGIYLDVDTGVTGLDDNSPPAGWDINPFLGGTGIGNSPSFQPVRVSAVADAAVRKLVTGVQISGLSTFFATGFGGSGEAPNLHIGAGPSQFQVNTEGYLGFKLTTNAGAGPYYGWMRLVLTGNLPGALIKDWAYENSANGSIVAGRVAQSAAVASAQVVTLSPGTGEFFTYGSALIDTGGNTNSLVKTGSGTTVLTIAGSYTGGTTISGGVLRVNSDATLGSGGGVTIENAATLQAGALLATGRAITLGPGGGLIDTFGQTVTLPSVNGSALTKIGTGTLILNGPQTYNSLTANDGTTAINAPLGTAPGLAAVSVSSGAAVKFGTVSQRLAALTIGAGATVTFTSGAASLSGEAGGKTPAGTSAVPEPGALVLLLAGAVGLLGRRRRIG
jgi:autotransporter-associated beta strand protein